MNQLTISEPSEFELAVNDYIQTNVFECYL